MSARSTNSKSLADCNETLDKIGKDLWLATVKQQNLEQLRRNKYPDCKNFSAHNAVHNVSELFMKRIDQVQGIVREHVRSFHPSVQEALT